MKAKGDVVTIGEVMIRLAPSPGIRLEDARSFDVEVGGAECNVAVALSSLGRRCAWVSKLANNELGRLIYRRVIQTGVDLSGVVWTEGARAGTYFVEFGSKPRPTKVIYDRKGSAASLLSPDEVDWEFVRSFRLLHLTGITPALSDSCRAVCAEAIAQAEDAGMKISLDVNYRSKLWSPRDALRAIDPMAKEADALIVTRPDARLVFGASGDPREVLEALGSRYAAGVVVLTLGSEGAIARADGSVFTEGGHVVEEIDRIGGGDAFAAGFLDGYLEGNVGRGLALGSAMAALKHTVKGDFLTTSREELLEIMEGRGSSVKR